MSDLTTMTQKAKSFWDTKEGTTGMVIGLGLFSAIGYGAYHLMPYVANLMENTFYALLFGGLSIAMFYALVIDGTLRSRLWLSYKLLMRAMTYSIIKYDPIGILREIQKKAKDRLRLVDESRRTVNGQVSQINSTVTSFKNDETQLVRMIERQRKDSAPPNEVQNNLTKLGKLTEAEKRLTKSLVQTQGFYTQLTRAYKALETIDGNIDFEIGIMEREYKAVNASHAAWKAVKAAFNGSDELDMLRNDTLAFLAEDYGNKLGAIESFMDDSKKFIDGVDLQNAMYADDGMKALENLNAVDLNIVQSKQTLTNNPSPSMFIPSSAGCKTVDYAVLKK
jgi:hypothetical protein